MPDTSTAEDERYVPAAGRSAFTRLYDPAMALTMREEAWRPALRARVSSDLPRDGIAVDVGSGTGAFAIQLADLRHDVTVIAVDRDYQAISLAKQKEGSDRIDWLHGLATELPVPDQSADVVSMSLLLHHLGASGKSGALAEAKRVLRPGGRLYVSDWGKPDLVTFAGFQVLRALDGPSNTRDHSRGLVGTLVVNAGFTEIFVWKRLRTIWGSLEFTRAVL